MARKIDKRLLGTWKSDRRKTFQDFVWAANGTDEGRRKFKALFGHLIIRYTRQTIYSRMRDTDLDPCLYEVLGSDSNSVAILNTGESFFHESPWIEHIHFERDRYYWVSLPIGSHNREWFKRVDDLQR
jgi:hypothetical protein